MLEDPTQFADRAVPEDILGMFLDVMNDCGLGYDVAGLSYYPEGMTARFDDGIVDIVTKTLGMETVEVDADAVRYVSSFIRDAAHENLVWDLSARALKREKASFYWLEANPSLDDGVITVSFDRATNTITVDPDERVNGDFAILFHPALVDVSRPVTIKTHDITCTVEVNPSEEFLAASMLENGDPRLGCVGKLMYSEIVAEKR